MASGPVDTTHHEQAEGATHHPSVKFYVMIGVILTVITALEVAVFYVEALAGILVPLLLVLSAAKFVLVVAFFMHLKFDHKLFTGVFVAPLVLGIAVIVSMIILFKVLPFFAAG